jgi:DNA-directed RNA polymerase subunit RPC12/RpoP
MSQYGAYDLTGARDRTMSFREMVTDILARNAGESLDLTSRRYLTQCAHCRRMWSLNRPDPWLRCPTCDRRRAKRPILGGFLLGRGRHSLMAAPLPTYRDYLEANIAPVA